ncbi:ribonucleoside hydrolase RihC [Thorsellia kenyensis]|uniref:Ribonucleoside hydrolase RihC n=1 Tax=Thorsellia kenyensis TaxID=1549888 RepID=A0ABV6CC15_9GAMM
MSNNQSIPIIFDTDPGIDDAVAIIAALFDPKIDMRLMTTVAGNVDIEKTTFNAQRLTAFLGKKIPLAKGAKAPLIRNLDNAAHIHGHSGMDGFDYDDELTPLLADNAVNEMYKLLMSSNEKITLVPVGPLTNIALLLTLYPEAKEKIARIVLMGGSAGRGNHTPNAEFNIFIDPEAAKIVFHAGLPLVMVGLDVTRQAILPPEIIDALPKMNYACNMLHKVFGHYRSGSMKSGLTMHDLCAIAYISKPELFETKACFVDIETSSELTLGTTVVDIFNKLGKSPNASVCLGINVEGFRIWAKNALSRVS